MTVSQTGSTIGPDTDAILQFRGVTKRFGGLVAVDDLSFVVGPGELVGLVGPNGAGKSTVFNLATGYLRPTTGSVMVVGTSTADETPDRLAQRGLGRTFQTPVGFPQLSVIDNVIVAASTDRPLLSALGGRWRPEERHRRERAMELLEQVGLAERTDVEAGELSGGELRMLEVARQLMTDPQLLLLDEPTAGVAPHLQENLTELIRGVHADGVTVVVVEHNLGFLLDLVDRVVCVAAGALIADDTPTAIRTDPAVISAYLGDHT